MGGPRHDDEFGVRSETPEEGFVQAQLIELAVHEPQGNRDALQSGRDVDAGERAQRTILHVEGVAAGGVVAAGLEWDRRTEDALGEPHPAVGQCVDRPCDHAVGGEACAAGERGAGCRDQTGDGGTLPASGVSEGQEPAHRVPHEQHRASLSGVTHRRIDRVQRPVQREVLVHSGAVPWQIDRGGGSADRFKKGELRAPHGGGGADAVHEDDLDGHGLSLERSGHERGGAGG